MTKRLFIAVKYNPSPEICDLFYEFKDQLRYDSVKWVDLRNMHITMKFLGDTDEAIIKPLISDLKLIKGNHRPFNIEVSGSGAFYRGKYPSILFLKTVHNKNLLQLVDDIAEVMLRLGFPKEERKFNAHITLGRIKFVKDIELFNDLLQTDCSDSLMVQTFYLFESKLTQKGPVYIVLEEFKIN